MSTGSPVLAVGDVRFQLVTQGSSAKMWGNSIEQQFTAYDRDGNGYLDAAEARSSPYRASFTAADVDGDEKLFKEEFVSYMGRLSTIQQSRTVLTATDRGRELFEVLDRNRDGRVSGTELHAGAALVKEWDSDNNLLLSSSEVPNVWQLTFGRGNGIGRMRMPVMLVDSNTVSHTADRPKWFTHMDRNSDGELFRREFLGPIEDFQRLDKNADGLLAATEVPTPTTSE